MRNGVAARSRDTTIAPKVERTEILDAAAVCFSKAGFSATSINDIADQLTATKGMVYHHYRSKAELFFDVHVCAMEMDFAAIRDAIARGATSFERLELMAHAHFTMAVTETDYQRVAMQGVQMHFSGSTSEAQRRTLSRILRLRDEYQTLFAREISGAVAEGSIPPQNVQTSVKSFLGVLNWVTLWFRPRRGQSASELHELAEETVVFAMRGLGAGR
jgi:AcrR family transcriptional regulator